MRVTSFLMFPVFLQAVHEQAQRSSARSSVAGPVFAASTAGIQTSEPEKVADTSGLILAHKVMHLARLTAHAILQS